MFNPDTTLRSSNIAAVSAATITSRGQRLAIALAADTAEGTTTSPLALPKASDDLADLLAAAGRSPHQPALPEEAALAQIHAAIGDRMTILHADDQDLPILRRLTNQMADALNAPQIVAPTLPPALPGVDQAAARARALRRAYEDALSAARTHPLPHRLRGWRGPDGRLRIAVHGPLLAEQWTDGPFLLLAAGVLLTLADHIQLIPDPGPDTDAACARLRTAGLIAKSA